MLPVVWEHHYTLREEVRTTNIVVLKLGRPGLLDATPMTRPHRPVHYRFRESCNKFSLLIGSRVTSPFLRVASFPCGKREQQRAKQWL